MSTPLAPEAGNLDVRHTRILRRDGYTFKSYTNAQDFYSRPNYLVVNLYW